MDGSGSESCRIRAGLPAGLRQRCIDLLEALAEARRRSAQRFRCRRIVRSDYRKANEGILSPWLRNAVKPLPDDGTLP